MPEFNPANKIMSHLLRLFAAGAGGGVARFSNISVRPLLCTSAAGGVRRRQQSTDAAAAKGSFHGSTKEVSRETSADVIVERLRCSFSEDVANGFVVPVYKQALLYGNKIAIKDDFGEFSYAQLYMGAKKLALQISNLCGKLNNHFYFFTRLTCWIEFSIGFQLTFVFLNLLYHIYLFFVPIRLNIFFLGLKLMAKKWRMRCFLPFS